MSFLVPAEEFQLIHPKYRADIDGLRAIAVLSVVGFHAFPYWFKGGFVGVDIFFVISGFLISSIIFGNLERNSFSLVEFYSRRINRIFPALLVVLIASYSFGWFLLLADEYRQLSKHVAGGAGFVSNFILWNESGYFDNSAETKPLLHLWSLGIEEQFYIVWPLLLIFVWKRKWSFVAITTSVATISFAINIYTINRDSVAAFYSPATRFWELMIGCLLAYITLHKPHLNKRYKNAQSIFGLSLIAIGVEVLNKERAFPGWWALLPTLGTFLIISAGPKTWINRHVLANKLLVWIGLISYPIYLWHWPLLSFARIVQSETPSLELSTVAVLISFALAWLTYRIIEKPIRFGKHGSSKSFVLILFMMVIGGVGYGSYKLDGLEFRQSVQNSSLNSQVTKEFVGPFWKYTKNKLCLNRYPFKESDNYAWWFCMTNKDEPPTVLILGNSHANQIYPGFVFNESLNHHSILSIGACNFARAQERQLTKAVNSPCSGNRPLHQEQFIANIISTSNSVRFAVIDGLGTDFDALYFSHLKAQIDFLEKYNIKVIIFTPQIRFPYDIKSCFSRPLKPISRNCEMSLESKRKLTEKFWLFAQQITLTNPNVAFFDQNDLFCNSEKCSMVLNGMPLFRDENQHISEYGSIELSKIFTQWARNNAPEILAAP